ncbi:hypothetical protein HGA64_03955, partial [Candidatus Falkowbacteria bacterium]|nr:hypothetical protein [Candidatus Falkowbacteria bacterium]
MKQMRYYRYGSVILLAGVFFLSGCTMPWQKKQPIPSTPTPEQPVATTSAPLDMKQQLLDQSKIKKFQDKQELVAFMEKNSSNSFVTNSIGISGVRNMAFNSASDALWGGKAELAAPQATTKAVADVAAGSGAGESDFSKTNTQVEGVDEADIIKTDGKYVFAINRQQLIIAEAFPAVDAKIVGKIEFKGQPHEMFLSGNRLVVFGSDAGNQLADPASVCNS